MILADSNIVTADSDIVTADGGLAIMFADTSLMELIIGYESVFKTAPANFKKLRYTKENLNHNIQTTVSNEVRSDRNVPALVRTSAAPGGTVDIELSAVSYDEEIEQVMASTWSGVLALSGTVNAQDNGSGFLEFISNSSTTGPTFAAVVVGQWIKVGGFVSANINGYHRVTAVNTSVATAHSIVTASPDVVESGTGNETISGSYIRNGTGKSSVSLEKNFTDLTNVFHLFTGMRLASLQLNVAPGAIVTGVITFQGATFTQDSVTAVSGTLADAATTDVLNAVDNVVAVIEDDIGSTMDISELSVSINNNLRGQQAVGSLGPVGIGYGRCVVTGSLKAYFESGALVDRLLNGTAFLLSWRFEDNDGNAMIITMPAVNLTSVTTVSGGNDQDVLNDCQYQAIFDPTTSCAIQFDKFAA